MEPLSFRVICSHFCPCVCVCETSRLKQELVETMGRSSYIVCLMELLHMYNIHQEYFTCREEEREVRGGSQGK